MLYLVAVKANFVSTTLDSIDQTLREIGSDDYHGGTFKTTVISVAPNSGLWLIDLPKNYSGKSIIPTLQVHHATKEFEDFVFVTPITKSSAFKLPLDCEAYQFLDNLF